MKHNQKKFFTDLLWITVGTLILAVGLNLFLAPNKVSPGGVSSVGTVLLHLFGIPLSVTNILLNLLLFILGYFYLGKGSLLRTILGVVCLSLFLQLTSYLPVYTGDLLVATLGGGLLMGVGVGLVLRRGASTGGSDLAAQILHRFAPHISVAVLILLVDCVVILLAAALFRSVTVAGYSLLSLFVASRITDGILTLGHTAKAVQIFSREHFQISGMIMTQFKRGVTGLHSKGLYTGTERMTLLCVVSPKELPHLVREIRALDPNAFLIISDAKEVLGEGFSINKK